MFGEIFVFRLARLDHFELGLDMVERNKTHLSAEFTFASQETGISDRANDSRSHQKARRDRNKSFRVLLVPSVWR